MCEGLDCRIIYTEGLFENSKTIEYPIFYQFDQEIWPKLNRFNPLVLIKRIIHLINTKEFEFVYDVMLTNEDLESLKGLDPNIKKLVPFAEDDEFSDMLSIEDKAKVSKKDLSFRHRFEFIKYGCLKLKLIRSFEEKGIIEEYIEDF